MMMPGRKYTQGSSKYRYGFNGKENDNDVKGTGNQQDYGKRIYDPRLGKFLSVDPITQKYPELTPYQFASNTPIQAIDLDGLEKYIVTTRSFIPMAILPNPAPWGSSQVKGDNREYYALNTTAYRTEQKVKVDFDNKTVSTFSNRANGSTGLDSKGNETNPPQHSDPDVAGPLPTYDKPALDKGTATTIYLKVDAHDKLISGAPHINYDLAITITPNVGADGKPMLDKQGNQTFDYQIKGIKDGFPAYELWITDEKSNKSYLLLHSNPNEAGKGPWSLWGTGDEKYNMKGNNSTQTPATQVKFSDTKNTPECSGDDCDK